MGEKIIFDPLEILILTRIQAGKGNGSPPGESEGLAGVYLENRIDQHAIYVPSAVGGN